MRLNTKALPALIAALGLTAALVAGSAGAAGSGQRVVALTPFSANTLVGIGVKPVAIGAMAIGNKGYSPKLKGIKQLPLSHPNGPNMEQIARIDPDTVLTSTEWRKGSQTMRDLAITVREMDAITATAVPAKIRSIGYAFGSRRATDKLVAQAKAEYAFATRGSKKSPHPITKRPKVLMVLGVGRTPYVFLNNSWGGSIARAAGATLLGGELRGSGGFVKVSEEYVVQQNPDIILAVPHGNAKDLKSIREHMLTNPAWSTTNAVKNGAVHATMDDALLQPNIDVGDTIKRVRVAFLKNW
ncbi:MAG: ABC transporter substrate-binding protein [Thermoleophilaceae bacterium]|nr:ABC transporter substrate-binding protein [Thermoleophilaceae bacterium]